MGQISAAGSRRPFSPPSPAAAPALSLRPTRLPSCTSPTPTSRTCAWGAYVRVLQLRGAHNTLALLDAELLRSVGIPIIVLLDNTRIETIQELQRRRLPPAPCQRKRSSRNLSWAGAPNRGSRSSPPMARHHLCPPRERSAPNRPQLHSYWLALLERRTSLGEQRSGRGRQPVHPRSFIAKPAFQILVIWRIFPPSNSIT